MTVSAVVLAAGSGSRFRGGTHKLLAPLDGVPVLRRALGAAAAAALDATAVVVAGPGLEDALVPGVDVLVNDRAHEGQATSLQVALHWARARGDDALVVGLGDQPGVEPAAWRHVAASDAAIAVATYVGRRGNPVKLDRSVWPLLPVAGDAGARRLMAERPDLVVEVACPGRPADIDTVEDLRTWS